jgi:hypothetical protein
MDGIMRHRQPKGPETDRPVLNHRVTSRLYPFSDGTPCTETYSPAAMDIAPATRPARPATRMLPWLPWAAATPKIRLEVDNNPSFAPRTAALSQPTRLCGDGSGPRLPSGFGRSSWHPDIDGSVAPRLTRRVVINMECSGFIVKSFLLLHQRLW